MTCIWKRPAAIRRHGWLGQAVLAFLFLRLGLVLIILPLSSGTTLPADDVDGRFIFAMLEYFWRCLESAFHGRSADFLNAPFFFPWPRVPNFSDTFWGDAAPYLIARSLGAGTYTAYQAWFVVSFVLTYASAFWCLRKFGLAPLGAATGAFLFSFALPVMHQHGHPQLLYRLWIPPAMLATHSLVTRRSVTAGAACILCISFQLAANIYLGLLLVLLIVSYTTALVIVERRDPTLAQIPDFRIPSRNGC